MSQLRDSKRDSKGGLCELSTQNLATKAVLHCGAEGTLYSLRVGLFVSSCVYMYIYIYVCVKLYRKILQYIYNMNIMTDHAAPHICRP